MTHWRTRASTTLTQVGRRVLAIASAVSLAATVVPRIPKPAPFVESSVRSSSIEWSPTLIKRAEAMADTGNLRLAALLCDEILADDRVSGCLREVRVRGLLGLPLEFTPPRADADAPLDELEEDWWTMVPEDVLSEWMEWGIILGVGVGRVASWERVEQPSGVRLIPHREDGTPGFDVIHPSSLRYDQDKRKWFARQKDGSELEVTPGDGTWLLYTPYGSKRPWARGAWRSVSRWWILKEYGRDDWGRYSERHGQGTLVGFPVDEGSTKEMRDELASDISDLGRETTIVTPPGYDLKLVEAVADTWETFQAQINMANAAIAIRILGQNLSTEVQGGSYAAAQVHSAVAAAIIRADDETSATTIRSQLIWWWAAFNFGDGRKAPWPKRDTTPPADTAALATTWDKAADALKKWLGLGAPVDKPEYARTFGMPLKEGAEWETQDPVALPPEPDDPNGGSSTNDGEEVDDEALSRRVEVLEFALATAEERLRQGCVSRDELEAARRSEREDRERDKEQLLGRIEVSDQDVNARFKEVVTNHQLDSVVRKAVQETQNRPLQALQAEVPRIVGPIIETELSARSITLASGDDPAEASGVINGQRFVDNLATDAAQATARAVEPDVAKLLELIDDLEDGDDWPERLRTQLAEHYGKTEDNAAFEQLAHKATILAELAGRVAVVEDL